MVRTTYRALLTRRLPAKNWHTALAASVAFSIGISMAGCGRPDDQSKSADGALMSQPEIFGKVIHFNGSHEADPYRVSGWSGTETNFTWTEGKAAVLALPVGANSGAVRLRMLLSAYTHPPELPSQPVEVYANGERITDWEVANSAEYTADIPKKVAGKNNTLTVQLRTPKATAPAEFSAKGDERVLGICCSEMELRKLSAP